MLSLGFGSGDSAGPRCTLAWNSLLCAIGSFDSFAFALDVLWPFAGEIGQGSWRLIAFKESGYGNIFVNIRPMDCFSIIDQLVIFSLFRSCPFESRIPIERNPEQPSIREMH